MNNAPGVVNLKAVPAAMPQSGRFRRKRVGSGRTKVLTDAGQVVFRYADEIFSLGRELVSAVKQRPGAPAMRQHGSAPRCGSVVP